MRKNLLIFFIIMFGFGSCTNRKMPNDQIQVEPKPYPYNINISEGFKNLGEIKLSSIADSIKYIVLAKNRDVILGPFPSLQMTKNEILINYRGLIYRFDLSGRFLNTVGKPGRGPEEYLPGSTFAVNSTSDKIYVKRNYLRDYISYKITGEFIGKAHLTESDNIWEFRCLTDSVFMYTYTYAFMRDKTLEDIVLAQLSDINGNQIEEIPHPAKEAPTGIDNSRLGISPPAITMYNNEVVLSYNDTIYKVNSNSITPGYIFNWGEIPHRQSYEELYYIHSEPSKKVIRAGQFLETYGKAYFVLKNLTAYSLFEYDRISGTTTSMVSASASINYYTDDVEFGFINDLDGGVSYYPKWTNTSGEVWIDYVEAIDFKENHNDEFLLGTTAIKLENKEKLRQFLSDLQIDDNPVLKIVYLKRLP